MTKPDFSKISLDTSVVAAIDRDGGYLGAKLGIAPEQLAGRQLKQSFDDTQIYTRPTDSLSVGQGKASSIEYWFVAGALKSVMLHFDNQQDGELIRDAFSRVYGRGFGTDLLVFWKGEKATMIFTVKEAGRGYLSIDKE